MSLRFLVYAVLLASALPAAAAERLNLLVLVADDMAHADMGCAGHPLLQTPSLDRLAADGVRFSHAFTPNPICTPSRAALLTGQDSWTNGCTYFNRNIHTTSIQFAATLADAGYETWFTGKWHNDGHPWERGFTSGANVIRGGCPVSRGGHERPQVYDWGQTKPRSVEKFSSTLVAETAMEFLDQRRPDAKPFLMYVSFAAPHDPWTPPGRFAAMYPKERIALPPNFLPRPAFRWFSDWHGTKLRDEALMPFPRTPEGVRDVRSRYSGMVSQMDEQIGRILDKLAERKLSENTLVIFVADHGISLGAHGFSGKQTMYEEGIRLPMIVRHPRLRRAAAVNAELVSLIDIYPTLCEAAGVAIPNAVEGRSLLGHYRGQRGAARDRIFASFHSPTDHQMVSRAIRTRRHKLIHNLTTNEVELYDLQEDPFEMKNLAGQPKHADVQKALWDELWTWRRKVEPKENLEMP